MTDREILFNDICMLINDEDQRNRLYIMLDKYEITKRETSIALLEEDRNEYLINAFIMGKAVKGCTKRTLHAYQYKLDFIFQYIGKTIDDISTEDIRAYMAKRLYYDKVSKTTVSNEVRYLKSFFNYICTEEMISHNPMLRIESIKQEKYKKEAFTEIELEKMRAHLMTNKDKAIFEVLLSTGCRVTELVNILLSDIKRDEVLIHGKGEKDRTVYLNAKALWAINEYLAGRKDVNPYLFPGKTGIIYEHIGRGTVEKKVRDIGKKAGVTAYPHKFRRTCATFALRRGMPIEQVSKMLGHESIDTTQIYLDLSEQDLKIAHKKYVI